MQANAVIGLSLIWCIILANFVPAPESLNFFLHSVALCLFPAEQVNLILQRREVIMSGKELSERVSLSLCSVTSKPVSLPRELFTYTFADVRRRGSWQSAASSPRRRCALVIHLPNQAQLIARLCVSSKAAIIYLLLQQVCGSSFYVSDAENRHTQPELAHSLVASDPQAIQLGPKQRLGSLDELVGSTMSIELDKLAADECEHARALA